MLSTVDSPHAEQGLCVKIESSIVEEIRLALFLATSIIKDEVPNQCASISNGQNCINTVQFKCGHLKYSHVSGEWSILHKPIPRCEDNMDKSGVSEHPRAMKIASLRPVSSHKYSISQNETLEKVGTRRSHNTKSAKETKGQQHKRKCRILSGDENGNVAQSIVGSMLPLSSPLKSKPVSPPIELVRCLLNGAEFISMMQCARQYVESSMRNGKQLNRRKSGMGSEAGSWLRRNPKESPIDLQSMVIALLAPAIRASQPSSKASPLSSLNVSNTIGFHHDSLSLETIILRFIDECIRFAHSHTCDLISQWSPYWQVKTNLLSTKVLLIADDENRSCLPPSFTQYDFMSKLVRNGNNKHDGNKKRNLGNSSYDSIASIHEFVRTCFEEPSKAMLHRNSVIGSSTEIERNPRVSSKELNDASHRHKVSEGPKGHSDSRRNKIRNRQPADSLFTIVERNYADISSARKKIPAYKRKGSFVEMQRYQQLKRSRHLSPTSVLENTSTATLQGKPTRIIDKVKQRDYSSPKMRRRRCKSSERSGSMKKEHDMHKFKPRFEKEKMSPHSLYNFFETKECKSHRAKFYAGHTSNEAKGRSIQTLPSQQDDTKDGYSMTNAGKTTQPDGVSRDLLMQLESAIDKGNVSSAREGNFVVRASIHKNERKQKGSNGSLHCLAESRSPLPSLDLSPDAVALGSEGNKICKNSDGKSDSIEIPEEFVSSDEYRDHGNEADQAISDKLSEKVSNLEDESKTEDVDYNLPWVNLSHIVSALHVIVTCI